MAELAEDTNQHQRIRTEGHVVECNGMSAVVSAKAEYGAAAGADYWTVGQLLSIHAGDVRVVGVLFKVDTVSKSWETEGDNELHIHVELVGEVYDDKNGKPKFTSGLSAYPHLGSVCHRIRHHDLVAIFENDDDNVVSVGSLSQNREIPALISIDNMISRHFAVVGSTGVGKSTAVSLIIRKVLEARPDVRVLILDPHNEFEHALPDKSLVIDEKTLELPFWLYTLEEITAAIFNGRTIVDEELELLRELIPVAKQNYARANDSALAPKKKHAQLTADTPVPYRMSDLIKLVDERMGTLDAKHDRMHLRNLMHRIDAMVMDPRYQFMFGAKGITDNMADILSRLFRVPDEGRPVSILQLAGIPTEIVNSTVSVLCRLAFDLAVWSNSKIKTLVICEEAHRYIPSDPTAGFEPTRIAIARVAKEGRKYGVHLGVITQRPSELDPTILSQCNTFFAMRLGNEIDQEIVRKAIPGGAASFCDFVPSLANREAIAFGQGASTPMRMMFENVAQEYLPGNEKLHEANEVQQMAVRSDLDTAINLMRRTRGGSEERSSQPSEEVVPQHGDPEREKVLAQKAKPQVNLAPPAAATPKPPEQTQAKTLSAPPLEGPRNPQPFTPPSPLRKPEPSTADTAAPLSRESLLDMTKSARQSKGFFSGLKGKN